MAAKPKKAKKRAKKPNVEAVAVIEAPPVEPRPRGRPTVYTQEIGDRICAELATGASLRSICRDDNLPAESTVRLWTQDTKSQFAAQYVRAREIGYLSMADETVEISDDGSNDWMVRHGKDGEELGWSLNGEHVQRSRLRVDTRKWMLSKCLPKIFGDKVTTEVTGKDGGPIETKDVSEMEVARKVAFLLGRAAGRGAAAKA